MATVTLTFGTFASDATVGDAAWSTPANAAASDDAYTTAMLADPATSQRLRATAQSGAASIPNDATITGCRVKVEAKKGAADGNITVSEVYLFISGSLNTSENAASGTISSTTDATLTFTFSTLIASLTPAIVKASNFGTSFRLSYTPSDESIATASVDYVSMEIDYTPVVPAGATHGLGRFSFLRRHLRNGFRRGRRH